MGNPFTRKIAGGIVTISVCDVGSQSIEAFRPTIPPGCPGLLQSAPAYLFTAGPTCAREDPIVDKERENDSDRRRLLTGLGLATAGTVVAAGSVGMAQEGEPARNSRRYPLDAWLDRPDAYHRVFIDSSRPLGAIEGLQYASNMLGAHVRNYGGEESDFSMVVCFRRFATPLGWGSEVWSKYGKILDRVLEYPDPATGEAFTANPAMMERTDLPNRGNTVVSLGERGVRFAVCDAATRVISGVLARATEGDADTIYEELGASLVPNARFVPAGVLTVTRAQEYGYSLLTAGL